jgi:antitoxin component of MazEF toxin-antitoxin module
MKKEVTLRQVGGSLALSVPADFVRAFRLSPGDRVTWEIISFLGAATTDLDLPSAEAQKLMDRLQVNHPECFECTD